MPTYDGFYDASMARETALGEKASSGGVVLREINALQIAIDNAIVQNSLDVEVGTGLPGGISDMTAGAVSGDYYSVWSDPFRTTDPDSALYLPNARILQERMNRVVNYFTRLGYGIKRERNNTLNEFKWVIRW
jgi:hypothetical protein